MTPLRNFIGREEMVYLKEKVDAGAEFVITQMFLDPEVFLDFQKECLKYDIKALGGQTAQTRTEGGMCFFFVDLLPKPDLLTFCFPLSFHFQSLPQKVFTFNFTPFAKLSVMFHAILWPWRKVSRLCVCVCCFCFCFFVRHR